MAGKSKLHTYDSLRLTSQDAPSLFPPSVKRTISERFKPEVNKKLQDADFERQQIDKVPAGIPYSAEEVFNRNSKIIKNAYKTIRIMSEEVQRLMKEQGSTSNMESNDEDLNRQKKKFDDAMETLEEQSNHISVTQPFTEELASMMIPDTQTVTQQSESKILDSDMLFVRLINDKLYSQKSHTLPIGGVGSLQGKDSVNRKGFAKRAHEYYSTDVGDGMKQCHIVGSEFLTESVKVAHIIPMVLRDLNLEVLLGTGYGTSAMSQPRNSLVMHFKIEKQFDKGQILIVPVNHSQPIQFKLVILNRNLWKEKIDNANKDWDGTWKPLDGKILSFNNLNRPSLTCLWLRFIVRYLSTNEAERRIINQACKDHGNPEWYTPIKLTKRRGILQEIATRLKVEFKELEGISGNAIDSEDDGVLDNDTQALAGGLLARRIKRCKHS